MIGILSDSHDNVPAVRLAAALFRDAGCSLVIHAGDFVAPFTARELQAAGCPVRAVYGNCDGEKAGLRDALAPFGEIRPAPLAFAWDGLEIVVVHIGGDLARRAARRGRRLIVHGHTHKPEIRALGEALIVNPGETGGWLTGRRTAALYDPDTGTAEIVALA